jgi:hypothetical protein
MIIGEAAIPADLATEVIAKMHEHVRTLTGLIKHSILIEEGGRMVILITDWPDREQCLTYHASRASRQFVGGTQHMLVGDDVTVEKDAAGNSRGLACSVREFPVSC